MDVLVIKKTAEHRRRMLVVAAANALALGPNLAQELAGVDTVKFIESVRHIYKAQGFNFTDTDLREIQHVLRIEVARRAAAGEVPVADVAPNGTLVLREPPLKPDVTVTEADGRRYVVRKDRKVF